MHTVNELQERSDPVHSITVVRGSILGGHALQSLEGRDSPCDRDERGFVTATMAKIGRPKPSLERLAPRRKST